ncbi:mannonate dehydratase [Sphingomonas sp. LR60]
MTQTMRWFGPKDPVRLHHIRQAGATGIVTALHEVPNGAVWTREAIAARMAEIAAAGLEWRVVESLPVDERIKTRSGDWDRLIDHYRQSLINLAACGIEVVTYNFMPLLDWTRTDLAWELPDGARALRFEAVAVAAYDMFILRRPGAADSYDAATQTAAEARYAAMDAAARATLERTIIAGLPGSEEGFTSAQFLAAIGTYAGIDAGGLRDHHVAFLEAVCPLADELGLRLVVHPDDPPFPIFGLPRVVSTEADVADLFARVPNRSNGLCMCTGSFGGALTTICRGWSIGWAAGSVFSTCARSSASRTAPSMRRSICAATPIWPRWSRRCIVCRRAKGGAYRCAPTTGIKCSTICTGKPTRAIRCSGGCEGWPSCAASNAVSPLARARRRRRSRADVTAHGECGWLGRATHIHERRSSSQRGDDHQRGFHAVI